MEAEGAVHASGASLNRLAVDATTHCLGLPPGVIVSTALAADTVSITIMPALRFRSLTRVYDPLVPSGFNVASDGSPSLISDSPWTILIPLAACVLMMGVLVEANGHVRR